MQPVTASARRRILDLAWELSLEEGYVIYVAIVSQEAFETSLLSVSLYAKKVRQEGIEITA